MMPPDSCAGGADEFYQLDIDRTIAATIESLGYPEFRYKFASKLPEYLILIERSSFRDHQAQLFNELTKSLEREGIFMARYFYDGDPRICCQERGEGWVHLVDLQNKFAGHRLLIIGTGEKLIDPVTGRVLPWAKTFRRGKTVPFLLPRCYVSGAERKLFSRSVHRAPRHFSGIASFN